MFKIHLKHVINIFSMLRIIFSIKNSCIFSFCEIALVNIIFIAYDYDLKDRNHNDRHRINK